MKVGGEANVTNAFPRTSCLFIGEIGGCVFDGECKDVVFHVIDWRCEREDPDTTIPTSGYGADKWGEFFAGGSTLPCAFGLRSPA